MNSKMKFLGVGLIIGLLVAMFWPLGKQQTEVPENSPQEEMQASPTAESLAEGDGENFDQTVVSKIEDIIPEDWQTYESDEYGFEISYPEDYEALDDEDNLYGWPEGVVLFSSGGQSYDLAIEIWDNATDYLEKYQGESNLVAKKYEDKFITLYNTNGTEEVNEMMETFRWVE